QLLDDGLREQLDERGRVGERRDRDASDEVRGDPRHGPDVTAYETRDPGALHLDHYLLATRQARGVHLRDRRGGDRLLLEPGEGALERRPEILLDDPPDEPEGLRRDLRAAALELVDQLGREEAVARRHDLAELDVRRAQPLEGATQPARQAGTRRRTARATFVELPAGERGPEERRGLREPTQRRQETTAHQLRHLRLGAGPSRVDAGTPHQMLGIDGPRATLAEGAEREIGRGARRHTRDLPATASHRKRRRIEAGRQRLAPCRLAC